ncbi:MAG: LON peptidase substrate-binding domain-containing protein [bacterium]|nr:LON peptidase substrate-binding domain-containing protein [bacterium]
MSETPIPTAPVPMFPLPGVFLFPHQVLPLHVFEPRYRDLVGDLLDTSGRFVIATALPESRLPDDGEGAANPNDVADAPPVLPVAGYGEIVRHEKLEDGRFLIWVVGLQRVRIREVAATTRYRQVHCTPFVEQQPGEDEVEALTQELHAATSARIQGELPLPETASPDLLVDLLVQTLGAPQEVLERVFTEPSVSERARIVLAAAADAGDAHDDDESAANEFE